MACQVSGMLCFVRSCCIRVCRGSPAWAIHPGTRSASFESGCGAIQAWCRGWLKVGKKRPELEHQASIKIHNIAKKLGEKKR